MGGTDNENEISAFFTGLMWGVVIATFCFLLVLFTHR